MVVMVVLGRPFWRIPYLASIERNIFLYFVCHKRKLLAMGSSTFHTTRGGRAHFWFEKPLAAEEATSILFLHRFRRRVRNYSLLFSAAPISPETLSIHQSHGKRFLSRNGWITLTVSQKPYIPIGILYLFPLFLYIFFFVRTTGKEKMSNFQCSRPFFPRSWISQFSGPKNGGKWIESTIVWRNMTGNYSKTHQSTFRWVVSIDVEKQ